MPPISVIPIGVVVSQRKEREDDYWDGIKSHIELDPAQFSDRSLIGLNTFSHVEVLFFMDRLDPAKVQFHSRHPRDNPVWPDTGIFAQRGGFRPNRIGATICRIIKIDGMSLELEGLDAIDGTPVLDIKPVVREFCARGEIIQPDWMTELMKNYWS